jgi:molybdate transport system substrate-binding protein
MIFAKRRTPGRRIVRRPPANFRALLLGFVGSMLLTVTASAAEVRVMISGGLTAAFDALAPEYERQTGNKLLVVYGPSMGTTANAIPVRLERGEPADVLIMVGYALADLARKGKVAPGSQIDLVKSTIGAAVKASAPKPDISSADALKRTLLAAKTVAYSDSASGVYISTEMFKKLGIEEEMKGKARQIPATPVGEIVARGEAELGFQQLSELKPVQGIEIIGPLPAELQKVTVFSAGIAAASKEPEAGKTLIRFLTSPAASAAIVKSGMEPIPHAAMN